MEADRRPDMKRLAHLALALSALLSAPLAHAQTISVTIAPVYTDPRDVPFDTWSEVDTANYIGDGVQIDCRRWNGRDDNPKLVEGLPEAERTRVNASADRCEAWVDKTLVELAAQAEPGYCARDAVYYGKASTIFDLVTWMADFKRKRPGGVGAIPAATVYAMGIKAQYMKPCASRPGQRTAAEERANPTKWFQ